MNDLTQSAAQFLADDSMQAVGTEDIPQIGRVANHLKMLMVAVPRPQKGQIAIKLLASSMHIDEIYAAQGTALGRFYGPKIASPENPYILGSSVSGTIVGLGEDVSGFKLGDDVIAIPSHHMETGSWATYRCVDQDFVMRKPAQLTHVQTAAVTMAACVAWGAIGFAKIRPGDHCVVVGATGAIGVMVLQYLKSLDCHVTAVCSRTSSDFAWQYGADEVVDYTQDDFGDVARGKGLKYDAVFDCVGGRAIEASAFKCLKKTGVFETIVGPVQYIGATKLSWPSFLKGMLYILWRMMITRLKRGPYYTFGEKYPRYVIDEAMDTLLAHNIRMPVPKTIPFEIQAIRESVRTLITHRDKGRTVIDFTL